MIWGFVASVFVIAGAARVDVSRAFGANELSPDCKCTATGIVKGKNLGKIGCQTHFGPRFGYLCYINGGSECQGAQLSKKTGVYWRKCPAERAAEVAKLDLLETLETINVKLIKSKMEAAKEKGVDADTMKLAQNRLAEIQNMMKVKKELLAAMKAFSHQRLVDAEQAAKDAELFEFLAPNMPQQIAKRKNFLLTKGEKEHALRQAAGGVDLEEVKRTLEAARIVKANPKVLAIGEARVEELTVMLAEAEDNLDAAMKQFDAQKLKQTIDDAIYYKAVGQRKVEAAQGRLEYLQAIEGDSLSTLLRQRKKAIADGSNPDVTEKANVRVKEIQQLMHNIKVKVYALIDNGRNPDEIEEVTREALRLRAIPQSQADKAFARAAELRR